MAVIDDIKNMLLPIGLPLAYRKFIPYKNSPVPNPPYIVYYIGNESGHGADNLNLYTIINVTIELYTDFKDVENESKIENAIKAYEYEKYEDEIESEMLFMVSYEFKIYEKIRR